MRVWCLHMWLQWWIWSAVDMGILVVNQPQGFEVTGKKTAFDTSKETLLPPNWEGLRKHSGVHVKNSYQSCHPQTLHSNSINRKPRSFEINDNIFTVCKLKTQQNGTIYLFTSLHSKN